MEGGEIGEVTCGGGESPPPPPIMYKCDQIKMRENMDRRVTTPKRLPHLWGASPTCKQALSLALKPRLGTTRKWA